MSKQKSGAKLSSKEVPVESQSVESEGAERKC